MLFRSLWQLFVTAPIDLVKVRLQSQTAGHKYRGPTHCVAVILREDGVRGLFRGMGALALRDVPCYGLYFLPYEFTCRMLTEKGKRPGEWGNKYSYINVYINGCVLHLFLFSICILYIIMLYLNLWYIKYCNKMCIYIYGILICIQYISFFNDCTVY